MEAYVAKRDGEERRESRRTARKVLHVISKSQAVPLRCADVKEERRYRSYSFLTLALHGVSGQRHALAALYPGERTPGAHLIGGWVGLRAGLVQRLEEKFFAFDGDRIPVVQSVVKHYNLQTELPQLIF
jgi:hypothetical protein